MEAGTQSAPYTEGCRGERRAWGPAGPGAKHDLATADCLPETVPTPVKGQSRPPSELL